MSYFILVLLRALFEKLSLAFVSVIFLSCLLTLEFYLSELVGLLPNPLIMVLPKVSNEQDITYFDVTFVVSIFDFCY